MKKPWMFNGVLLLAFVLQMNVQQASATITLPRLVRDSMVLQRDTKVNIWGWAAPGERLTITFLNKKYKMVTAANGGWRVVLPATKAGGPYTMFIKGSNSITLQNILFGDVWLCAGQSNMVHQMNIHDITYADEIARANYPNIRQFLVPAVANLQGPQHDLPTGYWKAAVGKEVRPFSAVAYFFAKKLYDQYSVPIGLINASVGGTPIEAWTSEQGLQEFPEVQALIQRNKDTAYVNKHNRQAAAAYRIDPINDIGVSDPLQWFDTSYRPAGWRTIAIPGYWEDQGIRNLDGVVWYRRVVDVPASMVGKPSKVFLGRIVDADVLYINGKQVGSTGYQYPQRRYSVPTGLLRAGKNLLVIKVTNTSGKGGLVPDKPYAIVSGKDTVDLKGYWSYKVGAVFPPRPVTPPGVIAQNQPTALYNGMIAPYTTFTLKGMLWYQGESNTEQPSNYAALQTAMIRSYRNEFAQPGLPFLLVQLPNFMEVNYLPEESNWAVLREAQLTALALPNTGVTVAIDLGEWNDIHPDNKKDVGERLALAARHIAYNEQVVYSGPLYKSATILHDTIILQFIHVGSGLTTNNGEPPTHFAIAGADKKFAWAKASIYGDTIKVWSKEVKAPLYVRYAWADNPAHTNLYNKEGLPASPFRTDR